MRFLTPALFLPFIFTRPSGADAVNPTGASEHCKPTPLPATPPSAVNIWAALTADETASIEEWLRGPARNLNLSSRAPSISDNSIVLIESYPPPKAEALAHLLSPDTVSPPGRYARVTIHNGGASEPSVKDYLVGPLPITGPRKTRMHPLTNIYHAKVPYDARQMSLEAMDEEIMRNLITPEMLGAIEAISGLANSNATFGIEPTTPMSFDGSFRRHWISFTQQVAGWTIRPVALYAYIDMSGTDASKWKILRVVCNNQLFNSTHEFLKAYHNGSLNRPAVPEHPNNSSWSSRKRREGYTRDLDDLPGPRSVSSDGLRFRLDRERGYVSWMGWGMFLSFNWDMGMSLWDVRFRGERLIYELSPQDILTHYSGHDPVQSSTAYLDRYWGAGSSTRNLVPEYDCPLEAVFLPATAYSPSGSKTVERAICIFEQDTGRPITTHSGDNENESGAVKGYALVLRTIPTVAKYVLLNLLLNALIANQPKVTITIDYTFYLDGTVEVRVSASGYLLGAYWRPENEAYGSKVHDYLMGTLHDHVINFKVDLDVAGQRNSLLETTTSQEEIQLPWSDDDWGQTVVQQSISRKFIDNEDQALLKYEPNFQNHFAIINKEAKNTWGNVRGYALHPGVNPIHETVLGSKRLLKNANWARYNLAVSQRKDTEPSSSSGWNANLPGAPPVDFHRFFDGESLDQEDLVMWVNVGTHHLPTAEDVPNTKTNIATSSFMLSPMNYFDYDVSMESRDAILLTGSELPGFEKFGSQPDFNSTGDRA